VGARQDAADRLRALPSVDRLATSVARAVVKERRAELLAGASDDADLVERAKSRSLTPEELTSSTFTVSNLGMFGVHSFTAKVDPPQAAIIAVGGIQRTPYEAEGGQVAPEPRVRTRLDAAPVRRDHQR